MAASEKEGNNMPSTCKKCGRTFYPECDEFHCYHCGAPLPEALGWGEKEKISIIWMIIPSLVLVAAIVYAIKVFL